ncbi:YfhE family protein [Edaphobacillus lindanitolerans]|uniref:YfhE-like protein n=1 Tax=Edaphobacillus lindanitolerans TaxID=550447 RepID=A0A1U7PS50_9BACI|nr:YfhE family protein [Edaphobacillus lindanitolerans]SIT88536.1 YfhE-like protein [Edaphobacillus lindanitolerans]
MNEKKPPHERMTEKDNGLTDTQEVLYQDDFNRADKATGKEDQENKQSEKDGQ